MATPPPEDGIDCGYAVDRRDNLHKIDGLHQPRRCHEEGGIRDAACGRDDLAATAMDGLWSDRRVEHLELDVAHRLVAERPLAACPAEALEDVLADRVEPALAGTIMTKESVIK